MTLLLSGFEPFAGETVNPSWDAIAHLGSGLIAGHQVVTLRLPCVFDHAVSVLQTQMVEIQPAVVLCVGQAGGRSRIGIERVALNVMDAPIPDELGNQPVDVPVIASGPAGYFATIPVKSALARVRNAGIPAEVSNSAGTFVCNAVFYAALHLAEVRALPIKVGFIHVPFSPAQAVLHGGAPSMGVAIMRDAVVLAAEAALTQSTDLLMGAGSSH